ncbi:hypothetical protein D9611_006749 [Ephemerocybe angulata]|uniref:Uncharacterized protein n=1 Tax=Ephemerocybe angulata TaxID=980116 RepID=A0A8H5C867_9AGAR|nr:hypothetical protein D9611_006749 [Tulosesus angulatus]
MVLNRAENSALEGARSTQRWASRLEQENGLEERRQQTEFGAFDSFDTPPAHSAIPHAQIRPPIPHNPTIPASDAYIFRPPVPRRSAPPPPTVTPTFGPPRPPTRQPLTLPVWLPVITPPRPPARQPIAPIVAPVFGPPQPPVQRPPAQAQPTIGAPVFGPTRPSVRQRPTQAAPTIGATVFGPPRPPVRQPPTQAVTPAAAPRLPALQRQTVPAPPPFAVPANNGGRAGSAQPQLPAPAAIPPLGGNADDDEDATGNRGEGRRIARIRRNNLFYAARRAYHDPATRHDLGRMDVECPHCHALHWMDEKLSKSSTASPKFGVCCGQGKVKLDAIPEPPALLRTMFTSMDPLYIKFREDVWKYNRAFSFTSLGVHEDHSVNGRGRGPPVFRISGELHHYSGALEALNGQRPRQR